MHSKKVRETDFSIFIYHFEVGVTIERFEVNACCHSLTLYADEFGQTVLAT